MQTGEVHELDLPFSELEIRVVVYGRCDEEFVERQSQLLAKSLPDGKPTPTEVSNSVLS